MLRIGVIGYGYWGPNIVRNFSSIDGARVTAVSDLRDESLKKVEKGYPGVRTTKSADELIRSTDIDAVAIVTPVFTHYQLAKKASRPASTYSSRNLSPIPSPRRRNSSTWPSRSGFASWWTTPSSSPGRCAR